MAEEEEQVEAPARKKGKKGLLIGLILALVFGAGGFYAIWSGMILGGGEAHGGETAAHEEPALLPDVAFVPIQPLIINLDSSANARHLRFQAQLEVEKSAEQDVTLLLPRVVDVLNGYLRAIDSSELERQSALIRMRAQMLRRIQVVTGEGRVRDLLIMEFVLN